MHRPLANALLAGILTLGAASPVFAADGALKQRSEMDPRYQWRIEDIYPTANAWQKDWNIARKDAKKLASYEGMLNNPKRLLTFLTRYEKLCVTVAKLSEYAQRGNDQDTTVSSFDALVGKAETLYKELNTATAFFTPEVTKLSEKQIEGFIKQEPGLKPYRQILFNTLRQAKHTLPKEQETLLANAGEMMGTPESVFGKLADADLKFPMVKDEQGQSVELSEGRYIALLDSEKREVRKGAFEGLLGTYAKFNNTFASLLNAEVKVHVFNRTVRKYPTALAAALDNENIPVSVYDSLVKAVNEGLPSLHRYYAIRKKILKLKDLRPYDFNVALVPGSKMTFPYEPAKGTLNQALKPLGPEYLKVLNLGLSSRWVDVYENKGKRSGAYSASVYGIHPFVLQSYQDTYWDFSTLAHELGHAVNGYLSQTNNNYFNSDNPIFVAEVASQTNEILLMDYMLKHTKDPKQKLFLLCQYADGFIGSIYRQTQYAEFEKAVHELGDKGETLTSDRLNDTWFKILKKYTGPSVTLDPVAKVGWSRIPHFYYNFYVYKYSTSYAASVAMAEKIKKEGKPAADRYLKFLKAGASKYPVDLLKDTGIDMTTPMPVKTALKQFDAIVTEIDKLSAQVSLQEQRALQAQPAQQIQKIQQAQ